jgi:predicted nucleic acid-binding protein
VVAAVGQGEIIAISTPLLWAELSAVLGQEKIRRRLDRSGRREITLLAASFVRRMLVFFPANPSPEGTATTDPREDAVVECAINGKADGIVTDCYRLLFRRRVGDAPIVSPTEFVAEVIDELQRKAS